MKQAIKNTLEEVLITPIKSMRLKYVPLLMIYFAFGASSFSGIAESFFIKERMDLSAEALAIIGVWLSLPWTIKMVFGQFADSIPILGSARRSYIFIAAGLMALSSVLIAGLAGQWEWVMALGSPRAIFISSAMAGVLGVVIQDVVADAMSVEVVETKGKTQEEIQHDLKMVQLLGRLALNVAMFLVAGLGGWLAQVYSYETIFLMTLIIPVISIIAVFFIKIKHPQVKPINKKVLYGGLAFAMFVIVMGLKEAPYAQEIIFCVSLAVVLYLLRAVINHADVKIIKGIFAAAAAIFIFRATPSAGAGAGWWMMDELGFDKAFFGTLGQIGAGLAILGIWFGAKVITEKPIATVLTWLTIIGFFLGLPTIAMYYGLHEWTQDHFGFGARTIAMIDTTISSPFGQLSMIPMLALIAIHAPKGNAATWFALMSSLMNLALTAGNLMTKFLNKIWVVTREVKDEQGQVIVAADYSQLGTLMIIVSIVGLCMPLIAIWVFLRKDQRKQMLSNS